MKETFIFPESLILNSFKCHHVPVFHQDCSVCKIMWYAYIIAHMQTSHHIPVVNITIWIILIMARNDHDIWHKPYVMAQPYTHTQTHLRLCIIFSYFLFFSHFQHVSFNIGIQWWAEVNLFKMLHHFNTNHVITICIPIMTIACFLLCM